VLSNCAGIAIVDNVRLEFQVIALEYIPGKFIAIEAICLNQFHREAVFKLITKNLLFPDKKTEIAFSIINSVIKEVELDSNSLHKLCIRDKKVFYITSV
jgi:hypothetical protein